MPKRLIEIFYREKNDDNTFKGDCCATKNNCGGNCCSSKPKLETNKNIEDIILQNYKDSFITKSYDVDTIDIFNHDFARYLIEEDYRLPLVIFDENILIINGEESYKLVKDELIKYI